MCLKVSVCKATLTLHVQKHTHIYIYYIIHTSIYIYTYTHMWWFSESYTCMFFLCVCACVGMDMITGPFRNPPWHVPGARFPTGACFNLCMFVCSFCFHMCMWIVWERLSSWPLLLVWCFGSTWIYLTSDHAFVSQSSQPRCPHTCSVVAARKVGVWAAESRIFREAAGWGEREGTKQGSEAEKAEKEEEEEL